MNSEVIVIQYLTNNQSWPVSGDIPAGSPTKFITVERSGGAREAMVLDMAEIKVSVYHKTSKLEAATKADEIADIVPEIMADYDDVTRSKVNSVVQLDDTLKGYHRYLVYIDLFHRR